MKHVKRLLWVFACVLLCSCSSASDEPDTSEKNAIVGVWVDAAHEQYYSFSAKAFEQYKIVDGEKDCSVVGSYEYDADFDLAHIYVNDYWFMDILVEYKGKDNAVFNFIDNNVIEVSPANVERIKNEEVNQ